MTNVIAEASFEPSPGSNDSKKTTFWPNFSRSSSMGSVSFSSASSIAASTSSSISSSRVWNSRDEETAV